MTLNVPCSNSCVVSERCGWVGVLCEWRLIVCDVVVLVVLPVVWGCGVG